MRHAAIDFAAIVDQEWFNGNRWDVIVTTDMCDVATLCGLMRSPARDLPLVCYFHENQIEYPNRVDLKRDLHFGFTNLTSALAASECWFNSGFNRDSFLAGLIEVAQHWPDHQPLEAIEKLREKALVMYPPIELPPKLALEDPNSKPNELRLVWAARWEHDKNPDDLLQILQLLRKRNVEFRLNLIGKQFRKQPPAFKQIIGEFGSCLERVGFQASRDEYWKSLHESDVILSTAEHEFFGLAVVEAMAAGCLSVLPERLSYPEIKSQFGDAVQLYQSIEDAASVITRIASDLPRIRDDDRRNEQMARVIKEFAWPSRIARFDDQLERLVI